MNKFLKILILGLLGMNQAQAAYPVDFPEDVWKRYYSHALVGVYGGHAVREGEVNLKVQAGAALTSQPANLVHEFSENGQIWGGLLGYQWIRNHRVITGIEAEVARHDIDHTHHTAFSDPQGMIGLDTEISYQQDWLANLSGRLGYVVTPIFIPYARLGVSVSRDGSTVLFRSSDPTDPLIKLQDRRWVYRFVTGLGLEIPVPCHYISFRAEYLFYSKGKTIETDTLFIDNDLNPIFNAAQQPYTKVVRIAAIWNFTNTPLGAGL